MSIENKKYLAFLLKLLVILGFFWVLMTVYADQKMSSLEDPVQQSHLKAKLVACHFIVSQVVAGGLLISHRVRSQKQEKMLRKNIRLRQTKFKTLLPRVDSTNPELN